MTIKHELIFLVVHACQFIGSGLLIFIKPKIDLRKLSPHTTLLIFMLSKESWLKKDYDSSKKLERANENRNPSLLFPT
tara:strand:+ start:197 stop:430 length:234 start_codon:yes stop_codon:yes gene_type:complete